MMLVGVGVDMYMQSARAFDVENAYAKRNPVQLVVQVEIMAAQFLCIMWTLIFDAYLHELTCIIYLSAMCIFFSGDVYF